MKDALSQEERQSILSGLESSNEEVRRLSVERLALLPVDEAVEYLAARLGDSGWRVRKAAVERVLVARQHRGIQEMLIASLAADENPGLRNAAFEALVACGRTVTARLIDELLNPDVDVRKLAIDALAAIGDPASREPLRAAIEDPDGNIRAAAVEALGVVGGSEEIAQVLAIANEVGEDVLVRLSALCALGRLEASVGVANLGETLDQPLLRPAAFELLGGSKDPQAVEVLLKGLVGGGRSSREAAMGSLLRALGRRDGQEADSLVGRLRETANQHDDFVVTCCEELETAGLARRMILIQFLGLVEDPRGVVPILRAGRDEAIEELSDRTLDSLAPCVAEALGDHWDELEVDSKVRACGVLGRVAGDAAESLLVDAMASHDVWLRSAAARAIGQGGFFDRLPDLVRRLEWAARLDDLDSGEEIAAIVSAIISLAEHPRAAEAGVDVQLVEVLSSRLAGSLEPVRLAIAQVLARLGCERDSDVLGYLLKDESPAVRRAAVQALARLASAEAADALRLAMGDESSTVRIAAANVLGDSGRLDALVDLARQMADEEPRVVASAVRAIGRLHEGRGVSVDLEPILASALEREPAIALAGLDALARVGGEDAARLAIGVLGRPEPDVVRTGVMCVGAHAEQDRLAEILPLTAHADWSVRGEAIRVLADRGVRKSLPALLRRLEVEDDAFVREAILRAVERLEE